MDLKVVSADIDIASVTNWLLIFKVKCEDPKAAKMDKDKLITDLGECISNLNEASKAYKSLQDEWRVSRQRNYDLESYIINQLNDVAEKEKEIKRLEFMVEELKKGL